MAYQRLIIEGNLGRDPELKRSQNGDPYCKFSVAVSEKRKGEDNTIWFSCTAFGKTAETAAEYLQKGKAVLLEGKVALDTWKDNASGENRAALAMTVDRLVFVGNKADNAGGGRGDRGDRPAPKAKQQRLHDGAGGEPPPAEDAGFIDDDLPF